METNIKFDMLSPKTIDAAVNTKFKEEMFSDRIWTNKADMIDKLQGGIIEAMNGKTTIDKLASDIKNTFNVSAYDSSRLVRTENARIQIQGSKDIGESAGVTQVMWSATLDGLTCAEDAELDGKYFPIDEAPECPAHPNCRCDLINVPYEGWTPTQRKDNETGDLIDYADYNNWKQRLDIPESSKYKIEPIINKEENLAYRGASAKSPMGDWGYAMFVDNKDAAYFGDGVGAGNTGYAVDKNQLLSVSKAENLIRKTWNADKKAGILEDYGLSEDLINEKTANIVSSFAPPDIIEDAEAFDNKEAVQWFNGRIIEPYNLKGINTPDGAIVFDKNIIKKIYTPPTTVEEVVKKSAVVKSGQKDYDNFISQMKEKYKNIWAEMSDNEMQQMENLERKLK